MCCIPLYDDSCDAILFYYCTRPNDQMRSLTEIKRHINSYNVCTQVLAVNDNQYYLAIKHSMTDTAHFCQICQVNSNSCSICAIDNPSMVYKEALKI